MTEGFTNVDSGEGQLLQPSYSPKKYRLKKRDEENLEDEKLSEDEAAPDSSPSPSKTPELTKKILKYLASRPPE